MAMSFPRYKVSTKAHLQAMQNAKCYNVESLSLAFFLLFRLLLMLLIELLQLLKVLVLLLFVGRIEGFLFLPLPLLLLLLPLLLLPLLLFLDPLRFWSCLLLPLPLLPVLVLLLLVPVSSLVFVLLQLIRLSLFFFLFSSPSSKDREYVWRARYLI